MPNTKRFAILLFFGFLIHALIISKLIYYYLSPLTYNSYNTQPKHKHQIIDRNNIVLASTNTLYSAYIDPTDSDMQTVLAKLEHALPDLDLAKIISRWDQKTRFIWLERHIENPSTLEQLAIPGVHLIQDTKRIYPYSKSAAHLIGFTDCEHIGLAGLEYHFDQHLTTQPLQLTIDIRVQTIVHHLLQEGMEHFQANAANAILININTGEILAYVSLPSYDTHNPVPNSDDTQEHSPLFDRNALGVYEFGSVLKVSNLAFALNSNKYNLSTSINIPAYIHYGRFKISDFGDNNPKNISLLNAFLRSSNKANALLALELGSQPQRAFLEQLGYFSPINLSFTIAKSLFPKKWSIGTTITSSFGYGIAISSLHLIQGFARLITGRKIELSLIKTNDNKIFDQFLPKHVSEQVQYALRQCVLVGYAKKAGVDKLFVGAKTGTANLLDKKGKYLEGKNRVTAIAGFPLLSTNELHKEQFALVVCLENPKASKETFGFATAGWIAAPIAKNIIEKIAPILGIYK